MRQSRLTVLKRQLFTNNGIQPTSLLLLFNGYKDIVLHVSIRIIILIFILVHLSTFTFIYAYRTIINARISLFIISINLLISEYLIIERLTIDYVKIILYIKTSKRENQFLKKRINLIFSVTIFTLLTTPLYHLNY